MHIQCIRIFIVLGTCIFLNIHNTLKSERNSNNLMQRARKEDEKQLCQIRSEVEISVVCMYVSTSNISQR